MVRKGEPMLLWSEEEERILRNFYPTESKKRLLEMLPKRSWKAIKSKAWLLKLRRNAYKSWIQKALKKFKDLSEFELGRLVGLIDAEGVISVVGHHKGSFRPVIAVTNKNLHLLRHLKRLIGGNIYPKNKQGTTRCAGQKTYYIFTLQKTVEIYALLSLIKEHLIIKREVAEAVADYCISRLSRGLHHSSYSSYELALVEKIRSLNKRGV